MMEFLKYFFPFTKFQMSFADGGDGGNGGDGTGGNEETVSKAEFQKLQESFNNTTKQLSDVKKESDEAKLAILDPDFLEFKESKKAGGKKAEVDLNDTDLESMSRKDFATFIGTTVATELGKELANKTRGIQSTLEKIQADSEVKEATAKYKDFWDYKEEMHVELKRNPSLTIEDSYKLAKQNKHIEKSESEKIAAAKASSEKPGGSSSSNVAPREFKSEAEANEDAWTSVVGDKDQI